jgi:hypothetical protein
VGIAARTSAGEALERLGFSDVGSACLSFSSLAPDRLGLCDIFVIVGVLCMVNVYASLTGISAGCTQRNRAECQDVEPSTYKLSLKEPGAPTVLSTPSPAAEPS